MDQTTEPQATAPAAPRRTTTTCRKVPWWVKGIGIPVAVYLGQKIIDAVMSVLTTWLAARS